MQCVCVVGDQRFRCVCGGLPSSVAESGLVVLFRLEFAWVFGLLRASHLFGTDGVREYCTYVLSWRGGLLVLALGPSLFLARSERLG